MWWDRGTLSASAVPSAGAPPASWLGCPLSTRKCQSRGEWSGESTGNNRLVVSIWMYSEQSAHLGAMDGWELLTETDADDDIISERRMDPPV